jgi:hypothetical protein
MPLKIVKLTIFFLTLSFTTLHAQRAVLSASGRAIGSGGTAGYAVGQVVYKSYTSASGTVAQGIQQSNIVITALDDVENAGISCSAYPNPTSSVVNLKIEDRSLENVSFQLYDLSGRLLQDQKINAIDTSISAENLATTTYLLKVRDGDKELKTFKIVKN